MHTMRMAGGLHTLARTASSGRRGVMSGATRASAATGLGNGPAWNVLHVERRSLSTNCPGPGGARTPEPFSTIHREELLKAEGADAREAWQEITAEAQRQVDSSAWKEGIMKDFNIDSFLYSEVLSHRTLACGLCNSIGGKLMSNQANDGGVDYSRILLSAFKDDPTICSAVAADMQRFKVVDPACDGLLGVYLFYKGIQAVACARVSHYFWTNYGEDGKLVAKLIQSEVADVYGVDIHPGASLGRGLTIDHATGVTIGETAVLGKDVYLMHDVTLGATGTSTDFDRHPKIGDGAFLGAKCTILGNIQIGKGATVAASALVNKAVPDGHLAVGVPARIIPPRDPIVPPKEIRVPSDHARGSVDGLGRDGVSVGAEPKVTINAEA